MIVAALIWSALQLFTDREDPLEDRLDELQANQIAASRSGYGMLALRGIEVGAAVVVLAFGTLLLAGYMAAERGACF